MSNFIYSSMNGKNDAFFGKYEHPIKAIIENESNAYEKQKGVLEKLFNIEKSSRYGETIIGESDFDTFMAKEEGQEAENDTVGQTFSKHIEHIEFGKEFTITQKMLEDATSGIGANAKARAQRFVRAYYKTRTKVGAEALIHATSASAIINRAEVDLTTGDKLPLFHKSHPYFTDKMKGKTQANYFYGDISGSTDVLEKTLSRLANKMRNFEDENGEAMEYIADYIIIPGNRPDFEAMVKKVVGSERSAGTDFNDINTQYGNWNIVVLPGWRCDRDEMMIMSSDANESLLGNMFFNRRPLDIRSGVDDHTRNYYWNGRCRFGVGFGTWKHILRVVNSTSAVTNASALA